MINDDIDYLEARKKNCKFGDLKHICDKRFTEFGKPKGKGDHMYYKTPWKGDPLVNIQPDNKNKKDAKPYQVRQVIKALYRLLEQGE